MDGISAASYAYKIRIQQDRKAGHALNMINKAISMLNTCKKLKNILDISYLSSGSIPIYVVTQIYVVTYHINICNDISYKEVVF